MKKQSILLILLIATCTSSCSTEDNELEKSIFVEDGNNAGLPEYSELGYNTFGAYYDRQILVSVTKVPVKVAVTGGETTFTFSGKKEFDEMSLTFKMKDFLPGTYSDLMDLNGRIIDLTESQYLIFVKTKTGEYEAQILNGALEFKRTKTVVVDNALAEVILAGTFEFQALVDGEPITVSNGRFDVGVGADNFFAY
jgi:hypothetical protein